VGKVEEEGRGTGEERDVEALHAACSCWVGYEPQGEIFFVVLLVVLRGRLK